MILKIFGVLYLVNEAPKLIKLIKLKFSERRSKRIEKDN